MLGFSLWVGQERESRIVEKSKCVAQLGGGKFRDKHMEAGVLSIAKSGQMWNRQKRCAFRFKQIFTLCQKRSNTAMSIWSDNRPGTKDKLGKSENNHWVIDIFVREAFSKVWNESRTLDIGASRGEELKNSNEIYVTIQNWVGKMSCSKIIPIRNQDSMM